MIMSIPLPLLLRVQMDLKRKLLLTLPFSLGVFTILCAILSKHLSFTQPFSGEWVFWYCREASTAMIVTNMPYSWALIRVAFGLKSFFGGSDSDHHSTVHGRSVQETSVISSKAQARNRGSKFFLGRKDGKDSTSAPSTHSDVQMLSWNGPVSADEKPIVGVDATAHSSAGSSTAESAPKPPALNTTAATLDKLYPVDDDDLELMEEKEMRRENRRVRE